MRKMLWITILLAAVALLSACAGSAKPTKGTKGNPPTASSAMSPVTTPTSAPAEVLREDLAKELKVSTEQVKIVRTAPKESLPTALLQSGCHEVNFDSSPELPAGQAVLLTVGPQSYVYYRDGNQWMRCGPSRAHLPAVGVPRAGDRQQMVYMAKEDLAKRLGIPADSITVESVDQVDWPDASLGCPEPGKMYAQVITPGFRILLKADGKTYEYHSGARHVVHCEHAKNK